MAIRTIESYWEPRTIRAANLPQAFPDKESGVHGKESRVSLFKGDLLLLFIDLGGRDDKDGSENFHEPILGLAPVSQAE